MCAYGTVGLRNPVAGWHGAAPLSGHGSASEKSAPVDVCIDTSDFCLKSLWPSIFSSSLCARAAIFDDQYYGFTDPFFILLPLLLHGHCIGHIHSLVLVTNQLSPLSGSDSMKLSQTLFTWSTVFCVPL